MARRACQPRGRSKKVRNARPALCGAVAALLALVAGCAAAPPEATDSLLPFFDAVQSGDPSRLFCSVAGAADPSVGLNAEALREAFQRWLGERMTDYEEGRDRGRVELDTPGVVLVKLFALGKGTFFSLGPVAAPAEDVRVVEMDVRFGYAHIDLSRFSPGTTFYVSGAPVGRVHAVRVPSDSREVSVTALDTARLRWTLVHEEPSGGCPGGWKIASAEPVVGSETTTEVTWIF